ncbi:MAG: DM13 domain-containing protein [Gammaproteobacteria bacterium]|nr:DM13 domain-containing protein [Gammaproteobacteria bacterium]
MNLKKLLLLAITHGAALAVGFAGGIYALPIIIAPEAPSETAVTAVADVAEYTGEFRRDLQDSDRLHWGEGQLFVSRESISFMGELAPGPDYMLYLSPEFVETEAEFERLKSSMVVVGSVKTFENFLLDVPADIDPSDYTTAIVWCETFGEFISAARYRDSGV